MPVMDVREREHARQQAIFSLLLESYPAMCTREEIIRELAYDPASSAERDRIYTASATSPVTACCIGEATSIFSPVQRSTSAASNPQSVWVVGLVP